MSATPTYSAAGSTASSPCPLTRLAPRRRSLGINLWRLTLEQTYALATYVLTDGREGSLPATVLLGSDIHGRMVQTEEPVDLRQQVMHDYTHVLSDDWGARTPILMEATVAQSQVLPTLSVGSRKASSSL
ncbi:hypothetical protein FOMPIDRAFT_1052510 [Fomitopsis schrenkii]|uniref:Uncharacterized protein n=1 Tax=Fomitopsis schrenkii TaxID=2126942 RepID=S8E1P6_FOMSC|nr:hypothetical protein FOMPIDRAFT_1052510 [Fomitopsis schrenkii]